MSTYLIDTNVFIQAYKEDYPFDVAVSFWDVIKQLANDGKIFSIDKVKTELYVQDDDLKTWCQNNLPSDFFKPSQGAVGEYGQLINWAANTTPKYKPNAIAEFSTTTVADAWLIAYAKKNDAKVVSLEIGGKGTIKRVIIPDVCKAFSIDCLRTMEMFRELGVTF